MADERTPAWSADGDTLYVSSERSGTWEAYEMPAGGGPARQLSEGGGYVPQPAPDGRSLFFLHGERRDIMWIDLPWLDFDPGRVPDRDDRRSIPAGRSRLAPAPSWCASCGRPERGET